jgi:hypothetical protein
MAKENKQEETLTQMQPSADKLRELKNEGYIDNSTAVVGYANRQEQYDAYGDIVSFIPQEASILDFGCGRGDFHAWYEITYGTLISDYLGVDANNVLIESGLQQYEGLNLINEDWNNLTEEHRKDWCINIRSNNLRYDVQTEMTDDEYVKQTIDKMFELCNQGIVISLTSEKFKTGNAISYNASSLLEWVLSKYNFVAVDHTTSTNQFLLIIYKK